MKYIILLLLIVCYQINLLNAQCICGCCNGFTVPCPMANQYSFNISNCNNCNTLACIHQFPSVCTSSTNIMTQTCSSNSNSGGTTNTTTSVTAATTVTSATGPQCVCSCCSAYPCSTSHYFSLSNCNSCNSNACIQQFPSTCTNTTGFMSSSCSSSSTSSSTTSGAGGATGYNFCTVVVFAIMTMALY
jgi:hypothetical protein